MSAVNLVVIQHDLSTGRYHPAWYSYAPLPGAGPDPVLRYRSRMHHTDGFGDLDAAREHADELALRLGQPATVRRELHEVATAGHDHLLLRPEDVSG